MSGHWLTRFDPDDGEPYGLICDCDINADHFGDGSLTFPDDHTAAAPSAETGA